MRKQHISLRLSELLSQQGLGGWGMARVEVVEGGRSSEKIPKASTVCMEDNPMPLVLFLESDLPIRLQRVVSL